MEKLDFVFIIACIAIVAISFVIAINYNSVLKSKDLSYPSINWQMLIILEMFIQRMESDSPKPYFDNMYDHVDTTIRQAEGIIHELGAHHVDLELLGGLHSIKAAMDNPPKDYMKLYEEITAIIAEAKEA